MRIVNEDCHWKLFQNLIVFHHVQFEMPWFSQVHSLNRCIILQKGCLKINFNASVDSIITYYVLNLITNLAVSTFDSCLSSYWNIKTIAFLVVFMIEIYVIFVVTSVSLNHRDLWKFLYVIRPTVSVQWTETYLTATTSRQVNLRRHLCSVLLIP